MHRIDFHKGRDISSVPGDELRQALRQFASGVTVVTAEHAGKRFGITVSAFTSISLDPPMIMVAINMASEFSEVVTNAEHFAVHILSAGQTELSQRFASSIEDHMKYAELAVTVGRSGAPLFAGPLAALECVLDQTLVVGTHMLMFGRVVGATSDAESGNPLLYYHRSYRTLSNE